MNRPRPLLLTAFRLAQRVGSLRRSNDHLRMSLTAALRGESQALDAARTAEAQRDEAMEVAGAWRTRCELLFWIADESKRDGVLGALGAIEGLPEIERPEVTGG